MGQEATWREETRTSISDTLKDPVVSKLLSRSNLTLAQFETLLVDQHGHDMANKRLTREEMAELVRNQKGISRGALNRTLRQARQNISEAVHTILLLGYGGMIESPSLAPFLEASEQLKSQTSQLRELAGKNDELYVSTLEHLLNSLEEAFQALYARTRDT
ncbi:MAG TPA: hypothetical protein VFV92_03180 [Candidatus Bathyarchaeia archaeon]|nr:hypothetical protein [Candidatus Bathyarchaeia archaeon]